MEQLCVVRKSYSAIAITVSVGLACSAMANITTRAVPVNLTDASSSPVARIGSEFLINTQITSDQQYPSIASLVGGGYVICWTDASGTSRDGSGSSIKGQLYSAAGAKVGSEFLVNTQTIGNQQSCVVSSLTRGGFVVTWADHSGTLGDGSGSSIKAQVFGSDGMRVGSEFLVNTQTMHNQSTPALASLSGGGFAIAWEDWDTSGDGSGHSVKAQIFSSSGGKVGGELVVNSQGMNNQWEPYIAGMAGGGFVVTWVDGTRWQAGSGTLGDRSNGSTKAQIFSGIGVKVGSEFLVNTQTFGEQAVKTIATLTNGDFVIAWEDNSGAIGDTDGFSVRAQIFSSVGTKRGHELLVNSYTNGNQLNGFITALPEGRFMIMWEDGSATLGDASGASIKAQVFHADGTKLGPEFLVNTRIAGNQYAPAAAMGADGNLFAVWMDASGTLGDVSGYGIKGQLYSYLLELNDSNGPPKEKKPY
jgi:hypothetical protein